MEILSYTDPSVALDNTASCTVTLRQFEGDKYATFKDVQNQFGGLRDNDTATTWYFAGRIGNVQFPTPTTVVIMIEGESSKLGDRACPGTPSESDPFSGNYDLLNARGFNPLKIEAVDYRGRTDCIRLLSDTEEESEPAFATDEWNKGSQDCGALITDGTTNLSKTWVLTTVADAASPYDPSSISPNPHVPANTNADKDDLYVGWRASTSAKQVRTMLTLAGDEIAKTNSGMSLRIKAHFRIGVRWTDSTHKSYLNWMKVYIHSNGMYNETFGGEKFLLIGTCGACGPVSGEAIHYYDYYIDKTLPGGLFTELLRGDADHWEDEYFYLVMDCSTLNNTTTDIDLDYMSMVLEYRTADFSPICAKMTDSGGAGFPVVDEDFQDQTEDAFPSNVMNESWTDSDAGGGISQVKVNIDHPSDLYLDLDAVQDGGSAITRLDMANPPTGSGSITITVDTQAQGTCYSYISIMDSDGASFITDIRFHTDGHIWAHAQTHDLGAFTNNYDYEIKVSFNIATQLYIIYIDGVEVLASHAFRAACGDCGVVIFGAVRPAAAGEVCIQRVWDILLLDDSLGTSWVRCDGIDFAARGVSDQDKFRVGQNTRSIALDVGSYSDVVVDPDPDFAQYIATNYKASAGKAVIQRICELEGGHWWDAWDASGLPRVVLRKTASFAASAYTTGAGLTSAHFHQDFNIQRPMNQYKGVEGWGNVENGIHWLEMDDDDANFSPLFYPVQDDSIMTTGDMQALCYARLQELKVLRPSIVVVLEAKYGDANYANYSALHPGQTAHVTFERPTIAETKYEIRRVDRHQTHPNGKMVTTIYLGLGLTPPEEELGRVIGKVIREVASARSSLVSPRVLGDLSLYTKIDGSRTFTGHVKLKDSTPTDALHAASKGYADNHCELSKDATPQLGGDLDLNDKNMDVKTTDTSDIGDSTHNLKIAWTRAVHVENGQELRLRSDSAVRVMDLAGTTYKPVYSGSHYSYAGGVYRAYDAGGTKYTQVHHDGTDGVITASAGKIKTKSTSLSVRNAADDDYVDVLANAFTVSSPDPTLVEYSPAVIAALNFAGKEQFKLSLPIAMQRDTSIVRDGEVTIPKVGFELGEACILLFKAVQDLTARLTALEKLHATAVVKE